ncbi:hypothetical protein L596_024405 [Steinernema carpocapsae]|uniref:Uncharacterized protein n=1 Tax=Steinernema carpocapsae TaxID=34508 RepID=A0A4U5MGM3_STECR|nr:hypothetical protein L596_024405 [Steinernema carpocapsae]
MSDKMSDGWSWTIIRSCVVKLLLVVGVRCCVIYSNSKNDGTGVAELWNIYPWSQVCSFLLNSQLNLNRVS